MASAIAIIASKQQRKLSWNSLCVFLLVVLVFSLCLGGIAPQQAYAHTSLTNAVPAANAELQQAPPSVILTFNERLEDGVYYIKVFDSKQKPVTASKAKLNANRMVLELELPKLETGNYIVTYHVISADGHPVEGTYIFAVGQSLSQQPGMVPSNMEHMHSQGLSKEMGILDIVNYLSRILYYVTMLLFTGWVLWLRFGLRNIGNVRPVLEGWAVQLQRGYLIAFLLFMFTHIYAMVGDGGPEAMAALFTSTGIGYIWLSSLVLSLLGFIVLYRNTWMDMLWVVLLWLFKSLNGHAAAFAPQSQTIMLDVVHMAAAAIWMGGLLMLLVLWRRSKEDAKVFFLRFSSAALASMALLIVSGVFIVLIFLPDIAYLVETQWGKMLLVKSALVLLVMLTGLTLRILYRKRTIEKVSYLLRIDAVLALLIACIVGIFTYLTPLPANAPLYWHVMGEKIHMTTEITPNVPGINDITVKVWLPEKLGKPKQVLLKLRNEGTPEIAPIEVPLSFTTEEEKAYEESYNMKKHMYKARGAYLPYPGYWDIEVRVMDSNDDETVYQKQIRLY
ncbi:MULTISPECIES: copper resistance CopC/CopD family protein [unclassified Paenibacillus]|uniref:copper resistance CopC/CopD family protein n=1 Tax=unclassified Paenibacillus TaxID=185978 RepID=UPI003626FD25